MATLSDLAKLDGVALAFEFAPDGRLLNHKANTETSPEMAAMAAQFCASVTMNFNTLAGAFSKLSSMPWVPQQGWAYSGGEYSVAIGGKGYRGVFIKTASADFNRLFQMLVADDAERARAKGPPSDAPAAQPSRWPKRRSSRR